MPQHRPAGALDQREERAVAAAHVEIGPQRGLLSRAADIAAALVELAGPLRHLLPDTIAPR
jgi:hypothetical protein